MGKLTSEFASTARTRISEASKAGAGTHHRNCTVAVIETSIWQDGYFNVAFMKAGPMAAVTIQIASCDSGCNMSCDRF